MVQAQADADGRLIELVGALRRPNAPSSVGTHFTRLTHRRASTASWLGHACETAPLAAAGRAWRSGTIRTSLFAATDEPRIPDGVATQLAEIFATDIDFHRELRKGDTLQRRLRGAHRRRRADHLERRRRPRAGRRVRQRRPRALGRLVPATAAGKGALLRLRRPAASSAPFLASPMEFSRVTSGFAMRMHPILQTWRQHIGVDYGAPTGTPVRSVGDGVGRVRRLAERLRQRRPDQARRRPRSTLYAHLSRIDVQQGPAGRAGRSASAPSARPAGPPARTCTSSSGQRRAPGPAELAKASEALPLTRAAQAAVRRSSRAALRAPARRRPTRSARAAATAE